MLSNMPVFLLSLLFWLGSGDASPEPALIVRKLELVYPAKRFDIRGANYASRYDFSLSKRQSCPNNGDLYCAPGLCCNLVNSELCFGDGDNGYQCCTLEECGLGTPQCDTGYTQCIGATPGTCCPNNRRCDLAPDSNYSCYLPEGVSTTSTETTTRTTTVQTTIDITTTSDIITTTTRSTVESTTTELTTSEDVVTTTSTSERTTITTSDDVITTTTSQFSTSSEIDTTSETTSDETTSTTSATDPTSPSPTPPGLIKTDDPSTTVTTTTNHGWSTGKIGGVAGGLAGFIILACLAATYFIRECHAKRRVNRPTRNARWINEAPQSQSQKDLDEKHRRQRREQADTLRQKYLVLKNMHARLSSRKSRGSSSNTAGQRVLQWGAKKALWYGIKHLVIYPTLHTVAIATTAGFGSVVVAGIQAADLIDVPDADEVVDTICSPDLSDADALNNLTDIAFPNLDTLPDFCDLSAHDANTLNDDMNGIYAAFRSLRLPGISLNDEYDDLFGYQ